MLQSVFCVVLVFGIAAWTLRTLMPAHRHTFLLVVLVCLLVNSHSNCFKTVEVICGMY